MENDIILEMANGQQEKAILATPFNPAQNEIDVVFSRTGTRHTLPLYSLCCIMMMGNPGNLFITFEDTDVLDKVEVSTRKQFHVRVAELPKYQTGFFGYSIEGNNPYKLIFFPFRGIKARYQLRMLGQILVATGQATHSDIKDALERQQKLRNRRLGEIIAEQTRLPQKTIDETIENALSSDSHGQKMRVGDLLVASGQITEEQVKRALNSQKEDRKKCIGEILTESGLVKEEQILVALATKLNLLYVNLDTMTPTQDALKALPGEIARELMVLPLEIDNDLLVIATSKPTDHKIHENLRELTSYQIELVIATSSQINEAINRYYSQTTS